MWPSHAAFAAAVVKQVDQGLNAEAVRKWVPKNSIPSKYWQAVVAAAHQVGADVTADTLMQIHAAQINRATIKPSTCVPEHFEKGLK